MPNFISHFVGDKQHIDTQLRVFESCQLQCMFLNCGRNCGTLLQGNHGNNVASMKPSIILNLNKIVKICKLFILQ